jgi:hypothetical protein
VLDGLLGELGSRPWLGERPVLTLFIDVERNGKRLRVVADDMRDLAMRDSFALGSAQLAMKVAFPTRAVASKLRAEELKSPALLADAAKASGGDMALSGEIHWSSANLGWIATWRLAHQGRSYDWTVRGVNFDEAFRVALRGSMQILSDNGPP